MFCLILLIDKFIYFRIPMNAVKFTYVISLDRNVFNNDITINLINISFSLHSIQYIVTSRKRSNFIGLWRRWRLTSLLCNGLFFLNLLLCTNRKSNDWKFVYYFSYIILSRVISWKQKKIFFYSILKIDHWIRCS